MNASNRRVVLAGRLAVMAALVSWPAPGWSKDDPLVRPLGPAEVDWAQGLIRVRAGAAADSRLPGPDAVRADAHRRAKTRALGLLRQALADLPLGPGRRLARPAIDAALPRARVLSTEYQSNGGVLLDLELGFADLEEPRKTVAPAGTAPHAPEEDPLPLALTVVSMPLEVMPTLLLQKEEWNTTARYRMGEPPRSAAAIRVRRDRAGRLLLPGATAEATARARAGLIIYLRSIARR